MLKLYDNIKARRLELGLSQEELAIKVGYSGKSMIAHIEKGDVDLTQSKIVAIAKALSIPPGDLMGWTDEPTKDNEPATIRPLTNRGQIPVFGRIPAGVPIDAIQDVSGYIDVPSDWVDDHGALIVKGNSMEPKYFDGDTVIFRVQPDCESGQDCIVYINGYDATLKKVIKTEAGIILQPLNPEYTPIICGHDNPVTILGVVVELRRKV